MLSDAKGGFYFLCTTLAIIESEQVERVTFLLPEGGYSCAIEAAGYNYDRFVSTMFCQSSLRPSSQVRSLQELCRVNNPEPPQQTIFQLAPLRRKEETYYFLRARRYRAQ